jgi:hypothetical protein
VGNLVCRCEIRIDIKDAGKQNELKKQGIQTFTLESETYLEEQKVKANLSRSLTKHPTRQTYGRVEVELHELLISAVDRGGRSASRSSRFTAVKRRYQVDPRGCQDIMTKRKIMSCLESNPGSLARILLAVMTELPRKDVDSALDLIDSE